MPSPWTGAVRIPEIPGAEARTAGPRTPNPELKVRRPRIAAAVLLVLLLPSCRGGTLVSGPGDGPAGSSSHPLYSQYDFGRSESVVDVGVQPLWIPVSAIVETIKRDRILRRQLDSRGIGIRFHPFSSGADLNSYLGSGALEAAFGGDLPAITAAALLDVHIVGMVQRGFVSIVARQPMLLSGLKGKRVGYTYGTTAHYALLSALEAAELTPSDVRMVRLGVDRMPEELARGRLDAYAAWEPTPTVSGLLHGEGAAVFRTMGSGYAYFLTSFHQRDPETSEQLVASIVRALGWISRSRVNMESASCWCLEEWENYTGRASPLSVDDVVGILKSDIVGVGPYPVIPDHYLAEGGVLAREIESLTRAGLLPQQTDAERIRLRFSGWMLARIHSDRSKFRLSEFDYEVLDEASPAN